MLDRVDVGIIVTAEGEWGHSSAPLPHELQSRAVPLIAVFNKCDCARPSEAVLRELRESGISHRDRPARSRATGRTASPGAYNAAPDDFVAMPSLAADLVPPGEFAVLVVPIDKEAPRGRLILPQVQTIRDLLDNDSFCIVVKERELQEALSRLDGPPALVITDSQAFLKVAADTPPQVPMTSFSILFARYTGDLTAMVRGAMAIDRLKGGDVFSFSNRAPPPDRRGYRHGQDPALAHPVCRGQAGIYSFARP